MQKEEPSLIPGPGKGMAAGRGMPLADGGVGMYNV